jgi:hypothetical protein
MLPQDLFDILIIAFMFVLRLGVPVAITLMLGRWLEKKLAPRESTLTADSGRVIPFTTSKNNIIQVRCWDLKRCDKTTRAQCAAYQRPDLPCWLARQVGERKANEACFTCSLYKPQAIAM